MQRQTGKSRRGKIHLSFSCYFSPGTLPSLFPHLLHNVLNLSAGVSYDTSKSMLLPKCQDDEMTTNTEAIKRKERYTEDEKCRAGS